MRLLQLILLPACVVGLLGCQTASTRTQTYRNPLGAARDIADPHVIKLGRTYYLYATTHTRGYDCYTSEDLVNWTNRGSVFSNRRGAWAPDVFHNVSGDGKFYLYYTDDTRAARGQKRIGVAIADSPLGPFKDHAAIVTNAIDAHMFRDDDGKYYLYYADIADGFKMTVQPMADPLTPSGPPQLLFAPSQPWESRSGSVNEGPFILKRKGVYYLMYSGSGADSPFYGIGYAISASPTGPFEKYPGNPIVKRSDTVFGPGHHSVVQGPDRRLWLVYHQKWEDNIAWGRFLAIDAMGFDEAGVIRAEATRDVDRPAPSR